MRLTDEELDAISARADAAAAQPWFRGYTLTAFVESARSDIPALIAEVKRLREELARVNAKAEPRRYGLQRIAKEAE